jgi:hypothetical protein
MSPIPYCFSAQIIPPYADNYQPFHDVSHGGYIEERGKSGKNVCTIVLWTEEKVKSAKVR